jgi:hypothetical protein
MTSSADDTPSQSGAEPTSVPRRPLSPPAQRALAEAAARRAEIDRWKTERPKEIGGRDGPDPTRYGDWENGGLASDF